MAKDNPPPAGADGSGGLDELLVLERNHLPAHDAGHREPIDCADDKEKNRDAIDAVLLQPAFDGILREDCYQENYDEDERDRIEHIDNPHHDIIDATTQITGNRP